VSLQIHRHPFLAALALLTAALNATAQVSYAPTADDALPAAVLGEGESPVGKPVAYFAEDPAAQGYLAEPVGEGPFGAVILIHEWNGLVERVKQVADAFAAEGYVALAADLYSGRTGTNREENMVLVRETLADTDKLVRNLDAAASYLKARDDVAGAGGKVAAIGWCYGGGVALTYALGSDNHEGTAIFYGRLLDDPERLRHIHHEIYGTFAEMDTSIPPADVDAFVAALRGAGVDNDVHIYDDVTHGFWLHVDRDPETNTAPALGAWQRLKAYLGRINGGNQPREPQILTD
jgi:carboxymethylenebutenolidase